MKKSLVRMISLLIALFGMCFAVRDAGALDAPHNTNDKTWSITCSLCHYNPSSTPSWASAPTATDNTFANNLCKSCHNSSRLATSPASYQDAVAHSSYATSTQYGTWNVECITCHNPHYQQQATIYATDPLNYVVTGTITALSTVPGATFTSLADSTKDFAALAGALQVSDFSGYLLIPNTTYPNRIYRVSTSSTNTLTVDGAINPNYAAVGSTYAIRFSKMIKDQIMTPTGLAPVRIFNDQGPVSQGTGSTTSVCQVCHTQTASYTNTGFASSATHTGDPDQQPGGYCKKCHQHSTGFKPPVAGCNDCHGNPPQLNAVGPNGLVGPGPNNTTYLITGATLTNPGAHLRHASTIGVSCEACHKGSRVVMPNLIDKQIRMGFEVNASNFSGWGGTSVTTGTIAVRSGLINGYGWLATQAGTQLVTGASYTPVCSNLYCHGGGTTTVVPLVGGTNRTPSWMGGPSQAACGTCHGVTRATYTTPGSHNRHVNTGTEQMGVACSDCHGTIATSHINGNTNWNQSGRAAGTYRGAVSGGSGMLAPSAPYGQCGNMYCHSSVQANGGAGAPGAYDTPTWGAATVTCDSCHGQGSGGAQNGEPATGNHDKHLTAYTQINCSACHVNGGDNTAQHADGLIQTGISTSWGVSPVYSQGTSSAPQNGYGSCSATYCHSQGTSATAPVAPNVTPTWGNIFDCAGCHNFNVSVASSMTTSAHSQHINDTLGRVGRNILCGECHRATVAAGDSPVTTATNHVNKLVNIKFDNNLNRDGENPLYNNAVTTVATGATKTAGLSGYNCSNVYCHSIGNLSSTLPASNTLVTAGGASYRTISWTGAAIGCDGCHGNQAGIAYPNYGPGSAGTTTANSHVKHVASYSYSCDFCHITTTDDNKPAPTYVSNGGTHLNRIEDVSFKVYNGLTGTYISTTKSCSNTYCHGSGTPPVWGGSSMACTSCHGNPPATGAHLAHVPAGVATAYGLSTNLSTSVTYIYNCGNCHPGSAAQHINGVMDINMQSTDTGATALKLLNSPTATIVGSGVNRVCLNIYCHSNGAGGASSNLSTAASPSWNVTLPANRCGACHGNPPTYASAGAGVAGANSHYNATGFMGQEGGHLVGQHFDNIFSGTTGTLSTGTTGTASHGNAGTSTTISCLTCHNTVVSPATIDTYAMNGTGSAMNCGACHNAGTPTRLQAGVIADKSLHVNGAANVAFISPMRSKAQLVNTPTPTWTRNVGYKVAGGYDSATLNAADWNNGTKTCVTACHNSEPVTWGDPNVTCYSCHKGL